MGDMTQHDKLDYLISTLDYILEDFAATVAQVKVTARRVERIEGMLERVKFEGHEPSHQPGLERAAKHAERDRVSDLFVRGT